MMSCEITIDEFLKETHTKVLLKYLHHLRAINHYYEGDTLKPEQWLYNDLPTGVTVEDIKAVLSTREHVPNKIERKEIRRQKAKSQRNK